MRKLALVGAIGVATAIVLAGCSTGSPADDETGDIRVWLVGTDTPDEARDYLKTTFEKENPGSTLTIEEQQWTGLVDLLTTSLSSNDSPDVVEVGNTQAAAFTSAGAFLDISDDYDALGGDDLLQGFVEAGSYDGKFYAAPYYSGARIVFYNTAQYATAGVEVPTTLDEYVDNAGTLAAALPGVSGVWYPGQDWYNALPFIWENGGEIAVQGDDGTWDAQFSSAESLAGLEQVQALMASSTAPKDGDETELWVSVPRAAGGDHLGSELGVLVDRRRRGPGSDRADRHPRLLRAPWQGRRRRPGVRRWLEHRDLGQVGAPDPGEERAGDHREPGVPDHPRGCGPRAGAHLAR